MILCFYEKRNLCISDVILCLYVNMCDMCVSVNLKLCALYLKREYFKGHYFVGGYSFLRR